MREIVISADLTSNSYSQRNRPLGLKKDKIVTRNRRVGGDKRTPAAKVGGFAILDPVLRGIEPGSLFRHLQVKRVYLEKHSFEKNAKN